MKKPIVNFINLILNFFLLFLSFKCFQFFYDSILHFVLKLKGFKNFGNFNLSGEELFLNNIKKYNLDYSLDIGAHTGNYSKKIIEITKSKVISFEPSKDSYSKLKKLKKDYYKKILIYNVALSNKSKLLNFYKVGNESQLASFEKNINKFNYVKKKDIKVTKIKTFNGDNFINKLKIKGNIDFIKIDAEGHEYQILLGLNKTIRKHKPKFIQFEMNWHSLFNGNTLFKISSQFAGYDIFRMLPYKSGLMKVDPNHPNNNLFHLCNYVLIKKGISLN